MDHTKCLTLHAFTEGAQYGLKATFAFRLKTASLLATVISDQRRRLTNGRHLGASEKECYTYLLLLDLKVGRDWAVRTKPHPRFYADTTDTVPIAVPALPRTEWWPVRRISGSVRRCPVCPPLIRKQKGGQPKGVRRNRRRREQTGRVMHVQRAASSFCPNMKKGPVW